MECSHNILLIGLTFDLKVSVWFTASLAIIFFPLSKLPSLFITFVISEITARVFTSSLSLFLSTFTRPLDQATLRIELPMAYKAIQKKSNPMFYM